MAEVSAVFAAANGIALSRQCLKYLRLALEGISHEIIVIDNGSSDGTHEWLLAQQDLRIIRNEKNLGMAAAWNQGKNMAEGKAVLFLHNDTIPSKNSVRVLCETLFSRPDIGAAGPLTNDCCYGSQQRIQIQGHVADTGAMQQVADQVEEKHAVPEPVCFLESFCLLMRKEALDAVGDFDERYFPVGFEDADLSLRLQEAGYSVLLAGTYVHHCGGSFQENGLIWEDQWERNRNLFHERWGIIPQYSMLVRFELLRQIEKEKEGLSVLDVGCACGTSLMLLKFHNPAADLNGIELNEDSAAVAKWFGQIETLDVETLEREDWRDRFDYIILADIIEHLRDPWSVLRKMRTFLKPGGRVIVSIPNVCHISNLWDMLHGDWEYEDSGILDRTHLRFFTKNSFRKYLEEAGFSVVSIEPKKLLGERNARLFEYLLASEDAAVTKEELAAIQWMFVAERTGDS